MSNANNFLQNMGMQMPMFTGASQQNANDDVDLHDIFAEYFGEDYAVPDPILYNNAQQAQNQQQHQQEQQQQQQQNQQQQHRQQLSDALAQQQQQLAANAAAAAQSGLVMGQQQLLLPTGQGIKTAWHTGSLPSMPVQQQQQGGGLGNQGNPIQQNYQQQQSQQQLQQPPAKRLRGEDLFLPGSHSHHHQQQQPMGGGIGQRQYDATVAAISQQQQLALAHAAAGVGGLSSRLGFAPPRNPGPAAGVGRSINPMAPQQHQQQQVVLPTGGLHFPVGMGLKFGAGGIATMGGSGGASASNGGVVATNNDVMSAMANNHAAAMAPLLGAGMGGVPSANVTNANDGAAATVVSNIQYDANSAYGSFHQQQQQQQLEIAEMMNEGTADERRLRNREHAKRSRVRKKFMLESLQQQVRGLQDENSTLRMLVQQHIPQEALMIIDECCSKSVLFGGGVGSGSSSDDDGRPPAQDAGGSSVQPLLRSDFSLIESLTSGQQNFVLSDPRLPDNPIVYATPGFYELTGYTREQVLGRNCRFLQGAGTERRAVEVIRTAVANGTDATVCLLNYRADGTPFWNQLFVAALRDADDCIVNYVGVLTMIEPNAGASALEDKVNAAHPITVGLEDIDDDDDDD